MQKMSLDWKKNKKPFDSPASKLNKLEYAYLVNKYAIQAKLLRRNYEKLAVKIDKNSKYIYFASPYQPEAVTSINAGFFENVEVVLDILMYCLPEGWNLYYKEHPGVFLSNRKGVLKRNTALYKRLINKNIKLVSCATDTFSLIDNSQAVASISGTVCWEAAVRGKPSINFGNSWYRGCKSILNVNSIKDCEESIKKIQEGFTPDSTDINRYVAAIEQVAVKNMLHRDYATRIDRNKVNEKEMVRISEALYKAYAR